MPGKKSLTIACVVLAVMVAGGMALLAAQGAAAKPPVSKQTGTITFNPKTGEVGAKPDSYEVPVGHQLELTLTLEVQGKGEATFANPPVTFPHGEPPAFHAKDKSPTEIVLTEINDNQKPGEDDTYYFKARVGSGGKIYQSPDPTIVNVGPPPGG